MVEVVVSIFAPELEGFPREPPPEQVVFVIIIFHLACDGFLQNMPLCKHAYAEYFNFQIATKTLAEVAGKQSVSLPALATSFGLGSNLDMLIDEFNLNDAQIQKLLETLG